MKKSCSEKQFSQKADKFNAINFEETKTKLGHLAKKS